MFIVLLIIQCFVEAVPFCFAKVRFPSDFQMELKKADIIRANKLSRINACISCHDVSRRLIGPSYKDISKRYKGNTKIENKLEEKIKKGGFGEWGVIPMPAHPNIVDEDIHLLVQWILQDAPSEK